MASADSPQGPEAVIAGLERQVASLRARLARYETWFATQDRHIAVLDLERQKFAAVVNQSDTYVLVADHNRRVRWTNRATQERFATPDGEWVGHSCEDVCATMSANGSEACRAHCPLALALETNNPAHREIRSSSDEVSATFYLSALPIKDPRGQTHEVLVLIQDLTDLSSVRESEARKSAMLRGAIDGIVSVDASGQIVEFNPAAEQLLGYTRGEVLGQPLATVLIPEHLRDAHHAGFARHLTTGESTIMGQRIESLARRSDGALIPVELTVVRTDLPDAPYFTGFIRDLSRQKRAEEEARALSERLQLIVANAPLIVFAIDPDGTITLSEGRGLNALRVAPGEHVGHSVFDVYAGEPEVLENVCTALGGQQVSASLAVGDATFQTLLTPVLDANGSVSGVIGLALDTTDTVQLQEQLRQAQKMEAVGRLAGGVAHDFNNLLTVILGHGEMLVRRLPDTDEGRASALEIHKAARRGAWLARQLLTFSRRDLPTPEVLDLGAVMTDMEKLLRRLIGEDIDVRTNVPREPATIRVDHGQLEQVVMNLALNARDAMLEGGMIEIEVAARASTGADWFAAVGPEAVVVSVRDTGCGMDEETIAQACEPFFTTKDRSKGTGLGLSIVYGIVQGAGGALHIDSAVGVGTTISVAFARARSEQTDGADGDPSVVATAGSETILLVEDEDAVRGLASDILTAAGYRVLEAGSGDDALTLAAAHEGSIDLLVTDVIMPRMSGGVLGQRLAEARPGLRTLYVSGYTDDLIVRQGVTSASAAFLQKPYTVDGLLAKVRQVLDAPALRDAA
jgi:two-component system cell cycle sensor histidine kinase/response regulator CckA